MLALIICKPWVFSGQPQYSSLLAHVNIWSSSLPHFTIPSILWPHLSFILSGFYVELTDGEREQRLYALVERRGKFFHGPDLEIAHNFCPHSSGQYSHLAPYKSREASKYSLAVCWKRKRKQKTYSKIVLIMKKSLSLSLSFLVNQKFFMNQIINMNTRIGPVMM